MSSRQIELSANHKAVDEQKSATGSTSLVPSKTTALVPPPATPVKRSNPSRWRRRGLWIGLAAAAGLGGWLFYAQPWKAGIPLVSVELVAPGPVTRVLAVNGRIAALRSVAVRSTVAGTLVSSLAEEGDAVVEGAVIARLDDTSQQAAVRQAAAALDQQLVAQAAGA